MAGPTAIGKSALAVSLVRKINAEIISLDSMQIYKGMDILSSQPAKTTRKKIPHHLLHIVSPEEEFDVAAYRRLALQKVRDIHKRGKTPLFVGGTGLYMNVLIDGIFKDVKKDERVRKKLYALAEEKGSDFLYATLKKADPKAASKIHPHDVRRMVRALEVYALTGKPISELWQKRKGIGEKYEIKIFGLNKDRQALYNAIDARVEKMFRQGLVKEVKRLLKKKLSRTAIQAIGISEINGYLEGNYSLSDAKELIKKNTRHYAKRQLTWFRKDRRIYWIEADKVSPLKEILKAMSDATAIGGTGKNGL